MYHLRSRLPGIECLQTSQANHFRLPRTEDAKRSERVAGESVNTVSELDECIHVHMITCTDSLYAPKEYSEYIERIFPNDTAVAEDANDDEFDGRVLARPGQYPHMVHTS